MARRALLLVTVALALPAGCGGTAHRVQPAPGAHPFAEDPQIWARETSAAQRRSLAVLDRDVARLRAATAASPSRTLRGTPALRRSTDCFLHDLERSPVGNLSKNRIIDHAAAAAASGCDQCFQQLEAVRPIPAIAEGDGH
jgi:hypothetical protein